eukprot:3680854-Prymnesium_polylepis.1
MRNVSCAMRRLVAPEAALASWPATRSHPPCTAASSIDHGRDTCGQCKSRALRLLELAKMVDLTLLVESLPLTLVATAF